LYGRYDVNGDSVRNRNRVQRLYEILFPMNIGFAIAYALFAYEDSSRIATHSSTGVRDLLQAFAGMLKRIAPLGVHMRTRSELLRSRITREAVFVALVWVIALIVYLLILLINKIDFGRLVLTSASGVAVLIAVLGCWLYIVHATWNSYEPRTLWDTYGYKSVLEIAAAGGLLYVVRNQEVWRGTLVFALITLFGFW
jgi:hypothetical protein